MGDGEVGKAVNAFIDAADKAGIRVQLVEPNGVNVWTPAHRSGRWCDETVWFSADGAYWGASYEHGAPATLPASELVTQVMATLAD